MKIRSKEFFNTLSVYLNRVFFSTKKRSGNQFKNEYQLTCETSENEFDICKITTKKIVSDLHIHYQVFIDNSLVRELKFENYNGTAGILLCKFEYQIRPYEPTLIYDHNVSI
jgi:hypothetical protein